MASNDFDRTLVLEAVKVTEAAAVAAWDLVGRGHEKNADQVAVDAMRTALNKLDINGKIVIGEGERDEAPMLYIGEKVGTGKGVKLDIALDPLEGTTLTAKAMPNALAVMAWAPRGTMLHAPDTYMDKIACGPGLPKGVIDLDASPAENVQAFAKAKGCKPSDVTVCVLDRPRHASMIESLREAGARIYLITDGDVAGVIHTTETTTAIDMYMGQGGAPEGVLACAALKCVGGQFQGRLVFRNDDEKRRAERTGITDFDKKYDLSDIIQDEAIFAATGVTKGAMLDGVRHEGGFIHAHSIVMASWSHTQREVRLKKKLVG